MEADIVANKIFGLYREYGNNVYIGEPVSQIEHMIQCAMLAEEEGYPEEIILGALFHDIGHLVGFTQNKSRMVSSAGEILGSEDHDVIGANFLRDFGISEKICCMVEGHVQAKRYNVFKDEKYRQKLSPASKLTLECQGGPMTAEEAALFEISENFEIARKVRLWDEQAKVQHKTIQPLERYQQMLLHHLKAAKK